MAIQKSKDDDFEFEIEDETPPGDEKSTEKPEIVVEDDTPPEDRGREPMPKEIVAELEADELEDYSEKVKVRLKQLKKVWHDERREKERQQREKDEALSVAQRLIEENKRLRETYTEGEKTFVSTYKQAAEQEVALARREYKEAYDSGDPDKMFEAQQKLAVATAKIQRAEEYKPTLQPADTDVEVQKPVQQPRLDSKTVAWQERNTWYGTDPEMTASALGLHQKLVQERGQQFVGTDEYWSTVDKTMRRRFPDYFGEEEAEKPARDQKAPSVVAPASRSRSAKKIVLKASQLAIAKRLGLTPEQYARELAKLEK